MKIKWMNYALVQECLRQHMWSERLREVKTTVTNAELQNI